MVEWSPGPPGDYGIAEIKNAYNECLQRFIGGELKSEEEVWEAIDQLMYLQPKQYEYLSQFDPEDIGCKVFGHTCPVFINQSFFTETKEHRRQGRYLPRDIMLKVVRRDNHICQICHNYTPDNELEFDHVIPHAKGGPTTVDNIRLLCRACNRKKSDSLDEIIKNNKITNN